MLTHIINCDCCYIWRLSIREFKVDILLKPLNKDPYPNPIKVDYKKLETANTLISWLY